MEKTERKCPTCNGSDYTFRGRKNIPPAAGQEAAVETRYLCKPCGNGWKERVAVKAAA